MADRLQLVVEIQNQSAGLEKEIAEVKQLREEVEKTAVAAQAVQFPEHPPPRIIDTTAAPTAEEALRLEQEREALEGQFENEQLANQVRLNALREEGAVSYNAYLAQTDATTAALSVEETQLAATKAREAAIEVQLQTIAQTRLELVAAQVEGDAVRAKQLQAELSIRTATLGVMRSEVLTAAELNRLTESEAVLLATAAKGAEATAAGGLLAGSSLSKARAEATVLARELVSGGNTTRTMGALLGSLGPTLTIAGIGAFALFEALKHAADEAHKLDAEMAKETNELFKQADKWKEIAAIAAEPKDVVHLADKIAPELDKASEKLREFRRQQFDFLEQLRKAQVDITAGDPYSAGRTGFDARIDQQAQVVRKILDDANKSLDAAKAASDAWQHLQEIPVGAAVDEVTRKITALDSEIAQLQKQTILPSDPAAGQIAAAANAYDQLTRKRSELVFFQDQLEKLTNAETKFATETDKVNEALDKLDFSKLAPDEQLNALGDRIDGIKDSLYNLGVAADSPREALETQVDLTKQEKEQVIELAKLWAQLLGTIFQINQQQGRSVERDRHREITEILRQEENLLRRIRSEQELIRADPDLSAEAQQALLHNAALREQAQLLIEIAKIEAEIAKIKQLGSPADQAQLAQLIGKLDEARNRFALLGFEIQKTTFSGGLQADLAQWVNSFGTASHQIAQTIEQSIGASLQGVNQLLIDSASHSSNWQQSLVGVEKQVAGLFLTMLEQMAIQQTAQLLHITTTTTAQTASGAAIAAAHAPAAAATSISSYGVAALVGEVLAIAAIFAIMAALGGAFHEGGVIGQSPSGRRGRRGPLGADERLIVAQDEEVIVTPDQAPYLVPTRTDVFSSEQLEALGAVMPATANVVAPNVISGGLAPIDDPSLPPLAGGVDPGGFQPTDQFGYPINPPSSGSPGTVIIEPPPPEGFGDVPVPPEMPGVWPDDPFAGADVSGDSGTGTIPTGGTSPDPYGGIPDAPWYTAGPFPGGNMNPLNPGYVGPESHPQPVVGHGGWEGTGASFQFLLGPAARNLHAGGALSERTGTGGSEVPFIGLDTEFMMRPEAHHHYGTEAMDLINDMRIPIDRLRLHDGGSLGSAFDGRGGGKGSQNVFNPTIHVFTYMDEAQLRKGITNSDANKKFIVDVMKGKAYEIGVRL